VTEPLETMVKSINGVEHVYSQTRDDGAMVTARFWLARRRCGHSARARKIAPIWTSIPDGIPEPLIVGRGIDDVAIMVSHCRPSPRPRTAGRPPT
jgi:multidrug efflux pump subunit AcrB